MSYKTIGIVITDKDGDAIALQAARSIAEREGGHLDVFCLGVDPVRYDASPMGATPALSLSGTDEARKTANALADWAQNQIKGISVPHTVQPLLATSLGLDASIARITRYCDLIVTPQPYTEGAGQLPVTVLEAVLFGTGAPILVVPPTERDYSRTFEHLMVAWNESDESLEAVRKAMPALEESDRAEIVIVDPPSHSRERSDPGGAICIMLARHGVKAEVSVMSKTLPRVSEMINRQAQDHSIDLIIMGAYGHSRFREGLIGGATREMLETAQLPVMMAH